MSGVQKLVNDGVITVDRNGVVRLTKSAWNSMVTIVPDPAREKWVSNHDYSKKEKHDD